MKLNMANMILTVVLVLFLMVGTLATPKQSSEENTKGRGNNSTPGPTTKSDDGLIGGSTQREISGKPNQGSNQIDGRLTTVGLKPAVNHGGNQGGNNSGGFSDESSDESISEEDSDGSEELILTVFEIPIIPENLTDLSNNSSNEDSVQDGLLGLLRLLSRIDQVGQTGTNTSGTTQRTE